MSTGDEHQAVAPCDVRAASARSGCSCQGCMSRNERMIRQSIAAARPFGANATAGAGTAAGDLGYCASTSHRSEWLARTLSTNALQLGEAPSRALQDRSTGLPGGGKPLNVRGLPGVVPVNGNGIAFATGAGLRGRIELHGKTRHPIETICYQRRFRPS
jgi:hypothetical protein